MPRLNGSRLSEVQRVLLHTLATYRYTTRQQLHAFTGIPLSSVIRIIRQLIARDWIVVHPAYRPEVLKLTAAGARTIGVAQPAWPSPVRIQHLCHRNEALIALKDEYEQVELYPDMTLFSSGLSPAMGEYAVRLDGRPYLMIVDDYVMKPARLAHAWTRRHKPPARFFSLDRYREHGGRFEPYWHKKAEGMYVFTTEHSQYERHRSFAAERELPCQPRCITPLWEYAL